MGFSIQPALLERGYAISIQYGGMPHFRETTSFVLENEDCSVRETVDNWLADSYELIPGGVRLTGVYESERLATLLEISLDYTLVNAQVIRKSLVLRQLNIPVLLYQVENTLRPLRPPRKLWSFDNADHKGGIVHGTYPAAGFVDDVAFGLLSDAGHRNWFTRNIRRRPGADGHGFKGLYRTADAKMLTISFEAVTLRLGCMSDYRQGKRVAIPTVEHGFGPLYHAFEGRDGFYTLSFDYRAAAPLNVRILKESPSSEVRAFHYQSGLPFDKNEYLHFEDTFFLSDTEGLPTLVRLWQGEDGVPELKTLLLTCHEGVDMPYHPLKIGQTHVKNTFIFAEPGDDIRSLRLASQTRLAEGLGFSGTDAHKVLYADMQMLCWITGERDLTPLNVPSINYAPDMYNRDSFWSAAGVHDAFLSKALFDRWGDTQTAQGGIGTIVTPSMGSTEVKDNEATCEWLWWALINRSKYCIDPPQEKIARAFDYCVRAFDREKSGICRSHFVLGQNDVATYPDEPTGDLAVNQGVWTVTLLAARELGLHADDAWIARAQGEYRAFYDDARGYIISDRRHPDVISCGDLLPEFVSLWLFDLPLLPDYMVVNTLDKIPRYGSFAYIIGHVRDGYFTQENKPFDAEHFWPRGVYYNGASWMREEVMAYAAGVRHGWEKGRDFITARLQGEIDARPDEPFSHEFIPTDPSVPGCWWPSTRVFCWNVFALTACEVAGMPPGGA